MTSVQNNEPSLYKSFVSTIQLLFNIQANNIEFKYIVVDKYCLDVLTKLYVFKTLIQFGIVGIFDINKVIPANKTLDDIDDDFKKELTKRKIYYFVLPTEDNLSLIKAQLKMFKKNVNIIFSDNVTQQYIKKLSDADYSSNIVYIKSVPFYFRISDKNIVITHNMSQLNCFLSLIRRGYYVCQNNYDLDHNPGHDLNHDLWDVFTKDQSYIDINKGLRDYRANYSTIFIMLKRNYDLFTPLVIPWYYESMLRYYYQINDNYIVVNGKTIRLDPLNDPLYEKIRYMTYVDVIKLVTERIHAINGQTKQIKLEEVSLSTYIEMMRKMIRDLPEQKKELDSLTANLEILHDLNKQIEQHNAFDASQLQNEIILNIISFDDFKNKISNIKHRKSLYNTLYIAYYIFVPNRLEISAMMTRCGIKIDGNDMNMISNSSKPITTDTITNTKTKIKNIFKTVTDTVNSLNNLVEDSIYLQFKPHMLTVLDCIFKKNGSEFTPVFMANISKVIDVNKIKTLIVHIDDNITYEEKRIISTYKMSSSNNGINILLHSDSTN